MGVAFTCPHCGSQAQFDFQVGSDYINANQRIDYKIYRCGVCDKLILQAFNSSLDRLIGQYPNMKTAEISQFAGIVPNEILNDFQEAITCFQVDCFKAASVMCRRSLQNAAINQGAPHKNDLIEQIKSLLIPNDMKDWAHHIRIFGNWGAHPDEDGLKEITKESAEETIEFVKQFYNYTYVMPKKVENARKTIENAK